MANKEYYESEGSEYLNEKPSVSKDALQVPDHNHDERYYTIDASDLALQNKADINHGHEVASPTVSGFMSTTDKSKLDGIAVNANNYVHPTNHPPSIITQDANNRFMTDVERNKLAGFVDPATRLLIEARKSATAQAIPASTFTTVTWDGTIKSRVSAHTSQFSNSRFTAAKAGIYHFDIQVGSPRVSQNIALEIYIFVNGVNYRRLSKINSPAIASAQIGGSITLNMAANDYAEIQAYAGEALDLYDPSYLVITEIT